MSEVSFSKDIEFEDEKLPVNFTVVVGRGGIGTFEFWGAKGYSSYDEIDEIRFDNKGLTTAQCAHIQSMIECNDLDDDAWDAIRDAYANDGPE